MIPVDRIRNEWSRAAEFPPNKEEIYPEHARVQEFDLHAGKRVLEYGCGGGADAMSYLRRNCDVTYVDITPHNVHEADRRIREADLHRQARGIIIDVSDRIPMPSGLFDVANAHGVIHHIPSPRPVLLEIRRLLKPGGILYCMLYTEVLFFRHWDTMRLLRASYGISQEEAFCWCTDGKGTPYAAYYAASEGIHLLELCGFRVPSEPVVYQNNEFRTFKAVAT
jgi:SAM-dependent methyltransferase